ncbi:ABC transporter permease [Alkaliphilus serpentinus]|uniref:ABC transporter permease n=2 Tax=Alkaliphilus serpentinus TaxID=1482731 RepID=A0A833HP99_9FIRM|nr:ABC transporter permease [Alkaliphilus serpentinus]
MFVIICYIGFYFSNLTFAFFINDLITRIARNSFLVLALIIPVLAGMGLNFAIVLGAMAGQVAIIMVTHWGIVGWQGFFLCVLISAPLAIIFGYLTGKLLNKTKGQEMITSLILGFFANGLYQLVFLIMVGSVIPMHNETLLLSSGVGLRVSIDLTGGLKYAIDDLLRWTFPKTLMMLGSASILIGGFNIYKYIKGVPNYLKGKIKLRMIGYVLAGISLVIYSIIITNSNSLLNNIKVPIITMVIIGLLCLFNIFISKAKIGQDFRTVGQDRHVATVSGIKSDKVRVTAIVISTLLAAWGQLFFLQNLGTLSTYGSHEQVGMFAIAALLIGGASVTKANIGHALLGTVLFHTLFIVSPIAGKNLFGDAQLGEYFRAFVAYGVIGLSLGMHAWKKQLQSRRRLS